MRYKLIISSLLMGIGLIAEAQQTVRVSNALDRYRNDELVVLKRIQLKAIVPDGKSQLLLVSRGDSIIKEVQYVDSDGDGIWDEAVFLHSFKPKENLNLTIELNTSKQSHIPVVRAHVRQRRKNGNDTFGVNLPSDSIGLGRANTDFTKVKLPLFLTEGPAWENDKVGFRLYFDIRNGKDIWGKTTTAMIMDTVGTDPKVSYHEKADWGMDILKVGSSLSAGALALRIKLSDGKDTLIRLGGKNMGRVIYGKIADGPLLARFRLSYPQWEFASGHNPISLTEEISIWGGQYFYHSDVRLTGAPEGAQLVAGFANHYSLPLKQLQLENASAFYSFGVQSENKDKLGLGIIALKSAVVAAGKTDGLSADIKDSFLVFLRTPKENSSISFRFLSAWEPADSRFSNSGDLRKFLMEQTGLFGSPIQISYSLQ